MQLNEKDIQEIVNSVMAALAAAPPAASGTGDGVFDKVEDALEAAAKAQKQYQRECRMEDRTRIVENIRKRCMEKAEAMARMAVEETRLGRVEDKIEKNKLVILKTPGPECLKPYAESGDTGLMLEEPAPFGLIGAITPTTNPTETIINNSISMVSAGNGVIFNVHPSAKKCCAFALATVHNAIVEAGGPASLVTMVREPTMDTVAAISASPHVRLLVGTGGSGLVGALLRSGKKVIGAGAGNPPVVVDETADLDLAAAQIVFGAGFDNNVLCLAEKEVFVVDSVADELMRKMREKGAYMLSAEELARATQTCLTHDDAGWHPAKQFVGQDCGKILEAIGVSGQSNTRVAVAWAENDHPFVQTEQLMPVLPVVRCKDLTEAIERAVQAEHGNRHTASMFSRDVNNLTRFAREVETTIFVKNACTLAGVGFGGEGYTTMSIAGPTGEGLTCAKSFARQRRCVLGDGGFRIT